MIHHVLLRFWYLVGLAESESKFLGFAILLWKPNSYQKIETWNLKIWGILTHSRQNPNIFESMNLYIWSCVARNPEIQIYWNWFSQGKGMKMSVKATDWWWKSLHPAFRRAEACWVWQRPIHTFEECDKMPYGMLAWISLCGDSNSVGEVISSKFLQDYKEN